MPKTTPYFEETQWLRDNRGIWFAIIASALASTSPLFYLMISQWWHGEPVGDTPMTNLQISMVLCGMVAITIVAIMIIRLIRLNVVVDRDGVHYNFFPSTRGWKSISKDKIVHYALLEKSNFFERIYRGYSSNRFAKTVRMRLQGRQIVRFQLDNRWEILIGTQRSDEFLKALKRMENPDLTLN